MSTDQQLIHILLVVVIGACCYQLGRGSKKQIINDTLEALINFKFLRTRTVNGEIEMIRYDEEK
jgi:hypothetical protein